MKVLTIKQPCVTSIMQKIQNLNLEVDKLNIRNTFTNLCNKRKRQRLA